MKHQTQIKIYTLENVAPSLKYHRPKNKNWLYIVHRDVFLKTLTAYKSLDQSKTIHKTAKIKKRKPSQGQWCSSLMLF